MTEPTWQVSLRREEGVFVLYQAKEQVIIPVAEVGILMANIALLSLKDGLCHCGHEVINHVQYCPEEDCTCTDGQFPEVNEIGKQALELLLRGAEIADTSGLRMWSNPDWQDEARVFSSAANGMREPGLGVYTVRQIEGSADDWWSVDRDGVGVALAGEQDARRIAAALNASSIR